jgi:hypothetical protein
MMIKFFHQGQNQGDFIKKYLLSEEKHQGFKPEILEGNPDLTVSIINSLSFKHKYVTGVISFREGEQLTKSQQHNLIESFQATLCPVSDSCSVNFLWIKHFDKGRLEMHFLMPRAFFSSNGSVKSFNLHPPGKANILLLEAFTRLENDRFGFEQADGKKMGSKNRGFYISVLDDLHEQRRQYIVNNFEKPKKTTRKGLNYGRHKNTNGFTGKNPYFRNSSNISTVKTQGGRKLQRSNGSRTDSHNVGSRGNDESNKGLERLSETTQSLVQHPINANQFSDRLLNLRKSLGAIAAPMNIEDELRSLAMQLNDCNPSEAPSIHARLNYLKGIKSRQEGTASRPKPK